MAKQKQEQATKKEAEATAAAAWDSVSACETKFQTSARYFGCCKESKTVGSSCNVLNQETNNGML